MEKDIKVEDCVAKRQTWDSLPPNVQQVFHSPQEYYDSVKNYVFKRRIEFDKSGLKGIYKEANEYYSAMLEYLKKNLLLYPYQFSDTLVNQMNILPFQYYLDVVLLIMKSEKSYDTLPNFTAGDTKRLMGVSRNEYIDIINKARGKKWMWRFNKGNILLNLLPKKPLDTITMMYWWQVECVNIPQNDFLKVFHLLTETEKLAIGKIKSVGVIQCSQVDRDSLVSLYQKNLVFFHVPVNRNDYVVVPTLKDFIMNRKPTDYFEKIVYDILATIDERTSISEIASILDVDVRTVQHAVSLCCRCSFAVKKMKNPFTKSSEETPEKVCDSSWVENIKLYHSNDGPKGLTLSLSSENLEYSKKKKKRRIAFIFDNSLTAHLMFGNLGPEIKRHAVTLFEIGKMTDESLDDFLKQLDTVVAPDSMIGEAQVYYTYAITLRQTLRFLRQNEDYQFDQCDGGVDLLRCESLQHLDSQTKLKILKTNYCLIVTQAPLKSKNMSLPMCIDSFFGPPLLAMNSVWFKFYLYEKAHSGPPTILFRKGEKVCKLSDRFIMENDRIIFGNWEMDPSIIKSNSIIQTVNDSLLYNPVLIQSLQNNHDYSRTKTLKIIFPFEPSDYTELSETDKKKIKTYVDKIIDEMHLHFSFGNISFLKVKKKKKTPQQDENDVSSIDYIPLDISFGIDLEDAELNKRLIEVITKRKLFVKENIKKHDMSMKKLTQDFIDFLDRHLKYKFELEMTHILPTKSIYFDGEKITDISVLFED